MGGNMYPGVKTINPLLGSCQHDCEYCYRNDLMWRFKKDGKGLVNHWKRYHGMPRLDPDFNWQKALGGKAKTVFVCSMTDLFAANVSAVVKQEIVVNCRNFPQHEYLFHTKRPNGFKTVRDYPPNTIMVVTAETNRDTSEISCAPSPLHRFDTLINRPLRPGMAFAESFTTRHSGLAVVPKLQLSIEPAMDFDFLEFIDWIKRARPDIVSIGADTGGNNLPEPSEAKLQQFVGALRELVPDVRIKKGLRRLWPAVEVT